MLPEHVASGLATLTSSILLQFSIQERSSFLVWRRELANVEEEEKLLLTPFEKNLEVWRQLWRVLERSDIIVQVGARKFSVMGFRFVPRTIQP